MHKALLANFAAAAFGAALFSSSANAQLADGGFETQAPGEIGANPGYCYDNNGGAGPQCTGIGSPWTVQSGGGFQQDNNSAWPGTDTPDGSYYGFIQNSGSLSQMFVAALTGTFVIDYLVAGRNNQTTTGNEWYDVLLNGVTIDTYNTQTGQPFTARSTSQFSLVAGTSYTLAFQGFQPQICQPLCFYPNGPDNTAYIDDVRLTAVGAAVPEPSTWAMIFLGFGAMGFVMRRGQRQRLQYS
jgi:hypothetical protein